MYENKKIFILVMARSGYEAAKVLAKRHNEIVLTDINANQNEEKAHANDYEMSVFYLGYLYGSELVEQDIDTFLDYAFSKRLSPSDFEKLTNNMKTDLDKMQEVLVGAPPCLQHILAQGITTGSRNSILFNVAVYCHKRFGDNFEVENFSDDEI